MIKNIQNILFGAGLMTTVFTPAQTFARTISDSAKKRPNVIYVFADQLRAQSLGYNGNEDVKSQNIDKLSRESLNFKYAISCMPVSTPYRACMLTGQYPLTNGMFMNDIRLNPEAESVAKIYKRAGYETGYIGKWHINGNGRSKFIDKEYRQGFEYFKVLECTHNYLHSAYYDNEDKNKKYWKGYDAISQTDDALEYIDSKANKDKPFILFLSWGGPHGPYQQVPQSYKDLYKDKELKIRDNVPYYCREKTQKDLVGYYAQITALDECIGKLQQKVKELGIDENTIFVFTSDHGDMINSHSFYDKQRPFDESIRVPFLLRYPALFGKGGREVNTLLNTPDILPTLLGLSNIEISSVIEGTDLSPILLNKKKDDIEAALIECITPFGNYPRKFGGVEYRGIRTLRYTYVKDLDGPWLLFDNFKDPYQMKNLAHLKEYHKIRTNLDGILMKMLKERGDKFLCGDVYVKQWNYKVNSEGTVDYTW